MLIVVAAACGSDPAGHTSTSTAAGPTGSTTSSPFTTGPPPAGYRPTGAGTGTDRGEWGSDCCGTDEPFTVLSSDGTATGSGPVVVSITGFQGQQEGLGASSRGFDPDRLERFELDGQDAIYNPARTDDEGTSWADLVAVRGDDLAVRVTAPDAGRVELVEILQHVEAPADRTRAPSVVDPPDGRQVVGSVDVDGVLAVGAGVVPGTGSVPGGPSSHGASWAADGSDGRDQLSVLTVPGRSADLGALAVASRLPDSTDQLVAERTVGGRPGLVLDTIADASSGGWATRTILVASGWGDTVVVTAVGRAVPPVDDLVALAASVQPTDEAGWMAFVIEATGGPGLHADEGRAELARGTAGDIEWLLQTGRPNGLMGNPDGDVLAQVDGCLKLSNRKRACADGGGQGATWAARSGTIEEGGPHFIVVSTVQQASSVRVTTPTDEATAPLVDVPGGGLRTAVVFVDGSGMTVCVGTDPPAPESMAPTRIDLLDAEGNVVACLGH